MKTKSKILLKLIIYIMNITINENGGCKHFMKIFYISCTITDCDVLLQKLIIYHVRRDVTKVQPANGMHL